MSFFLSSSLLCVNTSLGLAADSDIGLVLDLGEGREEVVRVVVVEGARDSVMLSQDHDRVTDMLGLLKLLLTVDHTGLGVKTGQVLHGLFATLVSVLLGLDREGILGLVTRVETPVGSKSLSSNHLLVLSATEEVIAPGSTSTEVVPVSVTVDGDG